MSAPVRLLTLLPILLLAAGCATTPGRTSADDPWEGFNRGVYKFNDTLDRAALKPVARAYRKVVPNWMRTGVGNFFTNLTYPTTVLNQFLQGKPVMGLKDLGRFLLNSTLGLGGLFDPASSAGLPANDEDFGQTLAVWGVGSGPYLVLPFLGPSSVRDGVSRVGDYYSGILHNADIDWEVEWGLRGLQVVNDRAELLPLDGTLQRTFDPYAFMRDAWVQRREDEIYDGEPPEEPLELEEDWLDPEDPASDEMR